MPVILKGDPFAVTYDSITVLTWEDKMSFDRFVERFNQPEVLEKILEDQKAFLHDQSQQIFQLEPALITKCD